jgi:heme/copper-type cytochrome/quinol oxidase subunit 3
LAAAVALGVLFLAAQVGMWIDLWTTGLTIRAHLYASFFWTLTVFHGLHVLAGLVVLAWLLPQARQAATPRRAVRVKVAAMFWHFVGVIWLLTFALLFLS